MKTFSVLIIGAGKIGACFDSPQSEEVLTHAHAFSKHPGFFLLGFVDSDFELAQHAAGIWGGGAFSSISDVFASHAVDFAVVAVPDGFHYSVLTELAKYPVKLVFAEKPLAKTPAEAQAIVALYHEQGITLAINYTRRFVPDFVAIRERIAAGEFGRFLSGSGYYGKGVLHNGSHLVDLLRFLLGEISVIKTLGSIIDWREDDPTCSALLELACGGQFIMQRADCRCYTLFEMDLLFEHARIRLVDAGFAVEMNEVHDSTLFKGYRVLSTTTRHDTDLAVALSFAANALYDYLTEGVPVPCTGDDGLRALQICANIIKGI